MKNILISTIKKITKEELKELMKNNYVIAATCAGLVIITLVTSFIIYKLKEGKFNDNGEIELMSVREELRRIKRLDEADKKSIF